MEQPPHLTRRVRSPSPISGLRSEDTGVCMGATSYRSSPPTRRPWTTFGGSSVFPGSTPRRRTPSRSVVPGSGKAFRWSGQTTGTSNHAGPTDPDSPPSRSLGLARSHTLPVPVGVGTYRGCGTGGVSGIGDGASRATSSNTCCGRSGKSRTWPGRGSGSSWTNWKTYSIVSSCRSSWVPGTCRPSGCPRKGRRGGDDTYTR